MVSYGLWVRYGGEDVSDEQIAFAAEHYSVAILQPREVEVATKLKRLNPSMTVLCYKCLSSTRSYETEASLTSGVTYAEAEEAEHAGGKPWFARRLSGEMIEWEGYPGHFQMNVWNPAYRKRWVQNVVAELKDSPFDGVMADNDYHGDYYGLNLPIRGAREMKTIRKGIDRLVREAGKALNREGKILVPNIAESRCDPGKWNRHSAYGGGFEEVFLGWGVHDYLDVNSAMAQAHQMMNPGPTVKLGGAHGNTRSVPRLSLLRASTDGTAQHPNFLAALAAFWIFGAGEWTALAGTDHDEHNDTPWREELSWDLGQPCGNYFAENGALVRKFTGGWVAVNVTDHPSGELKIPAGMRNGRGESDSTVVLGAHEGAVYRKA